MPTRGSGLVEIARDFMLSYRAMRRLFERFRAGSLRFEEIQDLVGDGEASLLFRLKERCHALFRDDERGARSATPREALFDLAVGSLFHEAMKFRENLYQREIYAPKVQTLRSETGDEADDLFQEFGRILSSAGLRLEEALQESEALLVHTRDQLRLLLADHREEGLIVRFLVEHPALVGEVFSDGLETLLSKLYGETAAAYVLAARSYLASAHFDRALEALAEARVRSGDSSAVDRLTAYAQGMQAFLAGRYESSLECLERWLDAQPMCQEESHAALALSAVTRISQVTADEGAAPLIADAVKLARRIEAIAGDAVRN